MFPAIKSLAVATRGAKQSPTIGLTGFGTTYRPALARMGIVS